MALGMTKTIDSYLFFQRGQMVGLDGIHNSRFRGHEDGTYEIAQMWVSPLGCHGNRNDFPEAYDRKHVYARLTNVDDPEVTAVVNIGDLLFEN